MDRRRSDLLPGIEPSALAVRVSGTHGLMWARTGELRETAVAFLGISDWKLVGTIHVGDTIFVNYTLAELSDSKSRPTQAIASFDVELVIQDGAIVQRGRKALLVSKVPLVAVAASSAVQR